MKSDREAQAEKRKQEKDRKKGGKDNMEVNLIADESDVRDAEAWELNMLAVDEEEESDESSILDDDEQSIVDEEEDDDEPGYSLSWLFDPEESIRVTSRRSS